MWPRCVSKQERRRGSAAGRRERLDPAQSCCSAPISASYTYTTILLYLQQTVTLSSWRRIFKFDSGCKVFKVPWGKPEPLSLVECSSLFRAQMCSDHVFIIQCDSCVSSASLSVKCEFGEAGTLHSHLLSSTTSGFLWSWLLFCRHKIVSHPLLFGVRGPKCSNKVPTGSGRCSKCNHRFQTKTSNIICISGNSLDKSLLFDCLDYSWRPPEGMCNNRWDLLGQGSWQDLLQHPSVG